jgi:hypothetical protein
MKSKRQNTYQIRKNRRYKKILFTLLIGIGVSLLVVLTQEIRTPFPDVFSQKETTTINLLFVLVALEFVLGVVIDLIFPTDKEIKK